MRYLAVWFLALAMLAGCGGGGGGGTDLPPGKGVDVAAFETYQTQHNGRNRVRSRISVTGAEQQVLNAFDSPAGGPAGYLNLIDLTDTPYARDMTIEVIAEVGSGTGKATRLLRLTADQSQFVNERNGRLIEAKGKYYFRGETFAWVTIDDGALLSGHHAQGLENLVLDFDAQTASISLRTGTENGSETWIELRGENLPFNIRTGAYGGDVSIEVRHPVLEGAIAGSLRGNVGGTPGYSNGQHGMTTSGLYTGSGTLTSDQGSHEVSVDGVFFGRDPNAKP
ncbi:hypothetical protein M3484_06570 [Pseudomonas sp. GX19020]|uniref:hypothetical protein n=1 Tax=Pseudomonas sp. GX19020 TaxID=2942277 RepID=UPI002018DD9E|nr:hypothetical protein [Pseudomonas sp. GX19020]MCL4066228.1 hypothetical protein [Pseudomonas sp. GX19020]